VYARRLAGLGEAIKENLHRLAPPAPVLQDLKEIRRIHGGLNRFAESARSQSHACLGGETVCDLQPPPMKGMDG
jgi:hypothetical protein